MLPWGSDVSCVLMQQHLSYPALIICSTLKWIAVLIICSSGGTGSPLDQGNDGAEMGFQTVWDYHQHRPRQETNVPCSTSSGHQAVIIFWSKQFWSGIGPTAYISFSIHITRFPYYCCMNRMFFALGSFWQGIPLLHMVLSLPLSWLESCFPSTG